MRDHLSKSLFKTREGLILVFSSVIYLAIGVSAKLSPPVAAVFGFIGLMAFFMPVFLLLFFFKIGGYRRDFLSTWFNTVVMLTVGLVPVIIVTKSAFFR
ncbi:hypothetical protein [Desulfuromonas sp. AOP6]|uniref:hypothetical protein n=1 Tax=Desulfuromonas sp. AOP6 TaxID=1566351 RepID=UPI0012782B3D|nr:hypothetical protein [Desulfuromonas sp. AOP6]BCA78566.1 hypothetical protein AOP6_0353 [Desulfuromonas sp. AOP6]